MPKISAYSSSQIQADDLVMVSSNIAFSFSEIVEQNTGSVKLSPSAASGVAAAFASNTGFSFSKSSRTLDPSVDLLDSVCYIVTMESTALKGDDGKALNE